MNDNNTERKRLPEIGNQPGTIDHKPNSKNPLLQYLMAGAIGLGVVVVPLIMLFALGGTPTATKLTAREIEDSASLADRELNNLKAQVALEIQATPERQVAQTSKPAPVAIKVSSKIAVATRELKPVAKAPSPKPTTIVIQPPTLSADTSTSTVQPVTISTPRPMVEPIAAPAPIQSRPATVRVAVQPKTVIPKPSVSVEQLPALGMFGGDTDKLGTEPLASTDRNLPPTPTLPVEANVIAAIPTPVVPKATAAVKTPERSESNGSSGEVDRLPKMIPTKPTGAVSDEDPATVAPETITEIIQATEGINTPSSVIPTKPSDVESGIQPVVTLDEPIQSAPLTTATQFIQTPTATKSQPIVTGSIPVMQTPSTTATQFSVAPQSNDRVIPQPATAAAETEIDGSTADQPALIPQQQSTLPPSPASAAIGFTVTGGIQSETSTPENETP